MFRTLLIAAGMAGLAAPAWAQEFVGAAAPCACGAPAGHGAAVAGGTVVGPTGPVAYEGVGGPIVQETAYAAPAPGVSQSGPIHPYSYYIDFPAPARTYVPYGPSDSFTFLGQAYGHAYDRWTWPAMSNASPGLGRYYQLLH